MLSVPGHIRANSTGTKGKDSSPTNLHLDAGSHCVRSTGEPSRTLELVQYVDCLQWFIWKAAYTCLARPGDFQFPRSVSELHTHQCMS